MAKASSPLDTLARHLLVEFYECSSGVLNDPERVRGIMLEAAEAAGATVVAEVFHAYRPQGVTGVVVIEESHLAVHTWPESGYAAVDFYTCGGSIPERAAEVLRVGLEATGMTSLLVQRGLSQAQGGLRIDEPAQRQELE